jgi:hypothetical protein
MGTPEYPVLATHAMLNLSDDGWNITSTVTKHYSLQTLW